MVAATAKAQLVKEATQISEQESLQLTRNLLRIAIFNISYIRGLFPEKYFEDKFVPALEMKIKKLLPLDVESRRLIDWMEKGVYDALQKRYLKTLLFGLCDAEDGPLVEEYDFSFFYPKNSSEEVTMVVSRNGNTNNANAFSTKSSDMTPTQMKISACKMVRTLVQLMRTLNHIPDERTIIMKLHYYDETPEDYEPPYFRSCTYEDKIPWSRVPLKMKVGEVNSKHFAIALKVKSILDPCEDENEEAKDSKDGLTTSSSDSEASSSSEESEDDRHEKITPKKVGEDTDAAAAATLKGIGNISKRLEDNKMADDSDNTEDLETEAENLERLKDWILSRDTNRVEMCDVLSNFPELSLVHIEEIMDLLLKECFLKTIGRDLYEVQQAEKEVKVAATLNNEKHPCALTLEKIPVKDVEEKNMYMKALYHALPLEYITIAQLQNKFRGEVNQSTARKLMDKMAIDGFIEETASNRRMGRKVMHTAETEKRFQELQIAFESDCQISKLGRSCAESPHIEGPIDGYSYGSKKERSSDQEKDGSTFGRFQTMGSEVTRHGQSDRDGSSATAPQWPNASEFKKPISPGKLHYDASKPTTSRESAVLSKHVPYEPAGNNKRRPTVPEPPNQDTDAGIEIKGSQDTLDSSNLLDKRLRKASMVKDPIYQVMNKRLRSES